MIKWDMDDLHYAAGFLDGEGCFYAWRGRISVSCENTYKPVIEWLCNTFGGSFSTTTPKKKHHRVTYRWYVCGDNAEEFCKIITPYLKEKAEQALLLIATRHLSQLPRLSRRKLRGDVLKERNRLTNKLKGLKHATWD